MIAKFKRKYRNNAIFRRAWTLFKHLYYSEKLLVNEHQQLMSFLKEYKVNFVLDVGANVGQFAVDIRDAGYTGELLSFEPEPIAFNTLSLKSSKDKKWHVYNLALSNSNCLANFHVSSDDALSSSLNFPTQLQLNTYPKSATSKDILVNCVTLDGYIGKFHDDRESKVIALKLDVQGHELKVLEGAKEVLQEISLIYCEVSFSYLYESQPSFFELLDFLDKVGFELVDIRNLKYSSKRLVQSDLILVKKSI